ncbi:MAG: phosphomannomutase CpsG [Rhizobiales bacterium]|nr:phosphomannomutase CpsG [Hyphomicrobiales bacterium]
MTTDLTCFKAYDIRGKLGAELNEEIAYKLGRAFATFIKAENACENKTIILGCDIRPTSEGLKLAMADGIMAVGYDVIDLGMVGTEEIYFATSHLGAAGGVEITASHNPIEYNGMKFVREKSIPMSLEDGLDKVKLLAEANEYEVVPEDEQGAYSKYSNEADYIDHLMTYINIENLKPLKLVVNAGNGAAGHIADALEAKFKQLDVPIELIKIHNDADGAFPNGIPNPMLIENRDATANAVKAHGADIGIAWDGDFDRCFFFDETGAFVEGYYIVGLLAEAFLVKNQGAKIVYDARLTWNSIDIIEKNSGVPLKCKSGHSFIKKLMREQDAIYGGEMSAHHYFKDFAYCDSGMIPWLLVIELLSLKGQKLSEMLNDRISAFPSSGEINSTIADPKAAIANVLAAFKGDALLEEYMDGISLEFAEWRFNLRSSNTEPVVRLNVEGRGNQALVDTKTAEILAILRA